jgi:hypothetical protein
LEIIASNSVPVPLLELRQQPTGKYLSLLSKGLKMHRIKEKANGGNKRR